ncbi:MAG: hypothetical protein Gaeavirus35_7 [Gaeavirus sp.]|uniref:Uncharacterized protein n=1 Tax=Gaeavirus sp. TaxID=2487767 RepID=A0A3G4ZZK1_9VIRU|nr:MAG: hypothetical protein Gaeavirus35_7 [Gaeavirus sp.]
MSSVITHGIPEDVDEFANNMKTIMAHIAQENDGKYRIHSEAYRHSLTIKFPYGCIIVNDAGDILQQ